MRLANDVCVRQLATSVVVYIGPVAHIRRIRCAYLNWRTTCLSSQAKLGIYEKNIPFYGMKRYIQGNKTIEIRNFNFQGQFGDRKIQD